MSCSISVILYNSEYRQSSLHVQPAERYRVPAEYVYSNLDFPYPVFLTTYHLAFAVSLAVEGTATAH